MSERGKCLGCGNVIGPIAILRSWGNWGKFRCPRCSGPIAFKAWLLVVFVLMALFVILERISRFMLTSNLPIWLTFTFSTAAGLLVIFVVPMMWTYREDEGTFDG